MEMLKMSLEELKEEKRREEFYGLPGEWDAPETNSYHQSVSEWEVKRIDFYLLRLEKSVMVGGVRILNVTQHDLDFFSVDGEVVTVPSSGWVINASPVEIPAGEGRGGVELVKVGFVADEMTSLKLREFMFHCPDVLVVGSIIAAQAYPGKVYAMISVPGKERDAKKLARSDKFTVF